MNVTLPDGTTIRNVPPGTTQRELLRRLSKLRVQQGRISPDSPAPIPRPTGRISPMAMKKRAEFPFPGQPPTNIGQDPISQTVGPIVRESVLPTFGTGFGALVGTPLGPGGQLTGAMLGGAAGEYLNQVLGITPEDPQMIGFAGITSAAGPAAVKVGQKVLGRPIGLIAEKLPITRIARANATMREAIPELQSLGTTVLQNTRGIKAQPAKRLYDAVERSGVVIPASQFRRTTEKLGTLADELEGVSAFPDAKQALDYVRQLQQALEAGGDPIGFQQIIKMRQNLGRMVELAEKASGQRLGTAKQVFSSLQESLDFLAKSRGEAGVPARLLKRATERAKLEFSVSELEGQVARFTRVLPDRDAVEIDINGIRNWLSAVTNPKHSEYNRNFAEAMKKNIPAIEKRLAALDKVASKFGSSPAGPGSIVVRGIGAQTGRSVAGALFGFGAAGGGAPAVIAGAGAMLGASLPEVLVAALSSPKALNVLNRIVATGKGRINIGRWAAFSQLVLHMAMPRDQTRETIRGIRGTPAEVQ